MPELRGVLQHPELHARYATDSYIIIRESDNTLCNTCNLLIRYIFSLGLTHTRYPWCTSCYSDFLSYHTYKAVYSKAIVIDTMYACMHAYEWHTFLEVDLVYHFKALLLMTSRKLNLCFCTLCPLTRALRLVATAPGFACRFIQLHGHKIVQGTVFFIWTLIRCKQAQLPILSCVLL